MIGLKIKRALIRGGYEVRILTRRKADWTKDAQVYRGDLESVEMEILRDMLRGASCVFHCAAELRDESKMWDVNVSATERILSLIPQSGVSYLCYLSSAGVVGLTKGRLVDEGSACSPQNRYERSKWAAEQLVARGVANCSTVILRPTDVIDEQRPGALRLPLQARLRDRMEVFLKGNECAHIIHAEDVADAAVYFMNSDFKNPAVFFVSCDHEPFNTFSGLWTLFEAIGRGLPIERTQRRISLPIIVPYILRRIWRGPCNYGNVRYSSKKLLDAGFRFRLGVEGAVRSIVASRGGKVETP